MKKSLLLISLLSFAPIFSQTDESSDEQQSSGFNRWTIEANAGQSVGLNPYTEGYSSSEPGKVFNFDFNNYGLGARYMISPKFGIKADVNYDIFKNAGDSKKFEVEQYRLSLQGVINASRLLGIEENLRRFGLLFHGGINVIMFTPKLDTGYDSDVMLSSNAGVTEKKIGMVIGVSPQFRITNKMAINFDLTSVNNYRQHFAWDGHASEASNNLFGQMINLSFGVNYSLGPNEVHGDWAMIEDKKLEEITELDNRINDLETLMNDTDKDGVPDYLDVENNSIAGVAVDTKGRMIDVNKNGVPDELEKLVTMTTSKDGVDGVSAEAKTANAINAQMVDKLINDGYVTAYFEFDQTDPTEASTEGIDFILTYMRNNPDTIIEIHGNADEVGNSEYNNKLADNRAANVKKVLIDAGIKANRLVLISKGEDKSVNPNSALARRLVRKVSFKIKK
jgi:OOP family OmpA-OmpF porin